MIFETRVLFPGFWSVVAEKFFDVFVVMRVTDSSLSEVVVQIHFRPTLKLIFLVFTAVVFSVSIVRMMLVHGIPTMYVSVPSVVRFAFVGSLSVMVGGEREIVVWGFTGG